MCACVRVCVCVVLLCAWPTCWTYIHDCTAIALLFLQNVHAPDADPEMTVTYYQRTAEQNEQLGLNDMKTENYTAED